MEAIGSSSQEAGSYSLAADPGALVAIGMTWSAAGDRVRYYYDGAAADTADAGLGTWAGTPSAILIGASSTVPANPYFGFIAQASLFDSEQSAAAMADLAAV
jgi:hypothetical protein